MGFAAEVPADWAVGDRTEAIDALARTWSGVEFRSELHPYGDQAFNWYSISVYAAPSVGGTLTETVDLNLSPLIPAYREQVQMRCCLTVGGEQAVEVFNYPPTRWSNRQMVVLHEGWEYRLNFYPPGGPDHRHPSGRRGTTRI